MREIAETTMVEFWDRGEHQMDHDAFKRWQRRNTRGYVMNFPPSGLPMFHKSGCMHIRDFSSNPEFSLTNNRKLCSNDNAELIAHVGRPRVDFLLCETCSKKSHAQL